MSTVLAQSKLKLPALGLKITAIIGGIFAILGLVQSFTGPLYTVPEEYAQFAQTGGAMQIISSLINIGVCVFLFYAANQMTALRSWGMCLAACIVALIPCFACCLTGIPFGIMGIIALSNADVKAAFQ